MTINEQIITYVLSEESFPDQAFIMKEGGSGDWMYVILEGQAKIKMNTSKGMLTIDTLTEGDFIGEKALFQKESVSRPHSAIADGQVLVGTLDMEQLLRDWKSQSERLKKLISSLMENYDESIKQVVKIVERSK